MIDAEDRLLLRAQLSDFSLFILLLLTHSCGGQSGPPQPIVAMVGDNIILPCHLEPTADAVDQTVEWTRPDLNPRFVHLRRDRVDLLDEQHPSYKGRTSLSTNQLKCGDLSLKLSTVKLSDAGTYKCLIPKSATESVVELVVGSVSSPNIEISRVSNGVVLNCKSKGWYPDPELLWLDGEGKLLSAGPTETVRGPNDLYTVSSRVTVEKRHSNSFTCRVQQKIISQTRETQIHVSDDFFMTQTSSSVRITISLVACFMCFLTVALVAWKNNKTKMQEESKMSNNTELQLLMEEQRAREHLMTAHEKMKYWDTAKARLDEELQRSEEELQHVEVVISTLTGQKTDLRKQREKVTSLLPEVRKWIEKEEKKQKSSLVKDKKTKKRENKIADLQRTKTEYEELLKNTNKLLEATDGMIMRMTEKKGKLENDKVQIIKHLKETEKKRDEVQKKLPSETEEKTNDP